jgi:DNA-binding CsgD family transcriptional regulator
MPLRVVAKLMKNQDGSPPMVGPRRTQLRQIFEKTGTRRQAEAAALVARLGLISR